MKRIKYNDFTRHVDIDSLFYDSSNDRYLRVTGIYPASKTCACIVTEWDYDSDRQIEDIGNFTWRELCHFELCDY